MDKTNDGGMCKKGWVYFILMLLFGVLVYREAMLPGHVLFTTDDSVGSMASRKVLFPEAFFGGWYDISAAGLPIYLALNFTNVLLTLLSPVTYMNWLHLLDLFIGSWFLMLFLRVRGIGWMGAVLGALTTFWFGSTFFLTYAGHVGKFGAVMFAGIYLYLVERAIRDRSWPFAMLAGAAMAGMFLEQQDSALFFSMVLGPYALFRGWQAFRFKPAGHARILIPLGLVAAMISLHSVYSVTSIHGSDAVETGDERTEQEIWDYCTQWSWPPAETIEFIAPGFMGWRTGEPSGPYWGNLGQSPGWQEAFGPNGKNFKLETFYIGFLPVMFMALGLLAAAARRREDRAAYQQMLFWSIAGLVTFILACGKYTPLYALFFKLPGISSIRNPVKFMQITQFSIGILAAIGLDYWLRALFNRDQRDGNGASVMPAFRKGVLVAAIVFTLLAVYVLITQGGQASAFRQAGWQNLASAIVSTMVAASVHLAIMAWIAYGLLTAGATDGSVKFTSWRHLGWAVLFIVMADQLMVSHRYVQGVKTESLVSRGDLIPDIENQLGDQRVYLWDRLPQQFAQWRGLYNNWQTILFAYHSVPTVNMISTRIPPDIKAFYEKMDRFPFKMWSHMAMGLAVVPGDFWSQVRGDPTVSQSFEVIGAYNLIPAGGTGYSTMRVSGQQPAQQVLLRNKRPAHRLALVGGWQGGTFDEALAAMGNTEPFDTVYVTPSLPDGWPASTEQGVVGSVELDAYRAGRAEATVTTERHAILRFSEYYNANWQATVDGERRDVLRCDGIFMGVPIEPGTSPQNVVIEYRPPRGTLYLQFAGFGLAALALVACFLPRRGTAAQNE